MSAMRRRNRGAVACARDRRGCWPRLKLLIARLQRMQFGRKSEKLEREIRQLELQLDDLEESAAERRQ